MKNECLNGDRNITPYLKSLNEVNSLSYEYGVPKEDVTLIALNLSGIHYDDIKNERARFFVKLPSGREYKMAITVTDSSITNFSYDKGNLLLEDNVVGEITRDDADFNVDAYWRDGNNHLTLNSNFKGLCTGCAFCGGSGLKRGESITDESSMEKKALEFSNKISGFSELNTIGLVTGCFLNEKAVVDHIKMVRRVFSKFGFEGEIQYIGSQLRSNDAIEEATSDGKFALYLTLEVFSRREILMKPEKASLTLSKAENILERVKKSGGDSSFLYIVGLDPFSVIQNELPEFNDVVTRLPQLQVYQIYKPEQIYLRNIESSSLDYYMKVRNLSESIFPDLTPRASDNRRGLWFSEYRGKKI